MSKLAGGAFGAFLAIVALCCGNDSRAVAQTASVASDRKPVIVELFTSEGCSSCPPADTLLQKLKEQQPFPGADIIALEEHVDYWNHDGWNDPYSSAEWTQRQLNYGALLKTEAYTPQMVVDGQSQFVGSSTHDASLAIQKAARLPKTDVAISTLTSGADGSQNFKVTVGKLTGDTPGDRAEVWLAVTEDGLRSSVNRGENAGHVLMHVATLRTLRKMGAAATNGAPVTFSGDARAKLDPRWNADKLTIVAFVQEKNSGRILGAGSIGLTSRNANRATDAASR